MALEGDISNRLLLFSPADEADWDAVYAEQLPRIYNYFRYRFADDSIAEDLTSRTFEKAWAARQRYERKLASFATWLVRIARNVAIDHLRAERPQVPLDEQIHGSAGLTPEDESAKHSDLARLKLLIGQLPEREQELLALKYGAGETNRAIAALTGVSESNVGTILHRAVQMLRRDW